MTNQWPDRDNRSVQGIEKFVTWLALFVLLLLYWGYIWIFERVNYLAVPPNWWLSISGRFPLFDVIEPFILVLAEFLSLGVLRHFIPVILAAWLARRAIQGFLQTFYALPAAKGRDAKATLNRLRAWKGPSSPTVKPDASSLEEERRVNPVLSVGGPAKIVVERGSALVTELNGHLARVLGPGTHYLARFEYPYQLIELRPQDRHTVDAKMMTKDGIGVTASLGVTFQIASDEQLPSHDVPFPFDPSAARRAAYAQSVSDSGKVSDWKSASLDAAIGALAGIVAESRLDELAHPMQGGIQPYPSRNREMRKVTREAMAKQGVMITDTRLGRLELPEAVLEKYLEYWRVYWEKKRRLEELEGQAALLEEAELARAKAKALIVEAVLDDLQRTQQIEPSASSRRLVALRLIEALQAMAVRSRDVSRVPERLVASLDSLQRQLLEDERSRAVLDRNTVVEEQSSTGTPGSFAEPVSARDKGSSDEMMSSSGSPSSADEQSLGGKESADQQDSRDE